MIRDKLFAFQVTLLFVIVFAVAFWMLKGAPLTGLAVQPVKPSAELPTFAESAARTVSRETGKTVTPDDMRRRLRHGIGQAILTEQANYEKRECSASLRRYIVGRIEHLFIMGQREPGVSLPATGEVTDATVEKAIATMVAGGYLTIDEFKPATGAWLETFVGSARAARVEELKHCQAE